MRLLLALLLLTVSATAQTVTGRVVAVHDGDTITVLLAGEQSVKVRLEAIDCPEMGQPYGKAAKQAMSDLVYGKDVTLKMNGLDRYQRTLGVVAVGSTVVNVAMVRMGLAWRYDLHDKYPILGVMEEEARANHRGLWADTSAAPVPPWAWRRRR